MCVFKLKLLSNNMSVATCVLSVSVSTKAKIDFFQTDEIAKNGDPIEHT